MAATDPIEGILPLVKGSPLDAMTQRHNPREYRPALQDDELPRFSISK